MSEMQSHKNAGRFGGFAGLYDTVRPSCPGYVVELLTRYLGRPPHTVVDIGCGTGLSTLVWRGTAQRIIGVEPSEDMLAAAAANAHGAPGVEFVRAFSDNTGLESGVADIITCSQSFHWMEPASTLREVRRLLKPGGLFAAYDCDWPPVCGPAVEMAWHALFEKVYAVEDKSTFIQYPKGRHLENIRASGHFAYAREIVFSHTEQADAGRLCGLALSQGGLQQVLRTHPALVEDELAAFRAAAEKHFGDQVLPIEFCYRMRLGVVGG